LKAENTVPTGLVVFERASVAIAIWKGEDVFAFEARGFIPAKQVFYDLSLVVFAARKAKFNNVFNAFKKRVARLGIANADYGYYK
jgi:hypothetical protein